MNEQAIVLLKEAYNLCQDEKFDLSIKRCEEAMQLYSAEDDSVGISCCLINISNVYRSQAFHEYRKTTTDWVNFPLDQKDLDEYFTYLGCLGSTMWYSRGIGSPGRLK